MPANDRLEKLQEAYSKSAGYTVDRSDVGLWARPSWMSVPPTRDELMEQDFARLQTTHPTVVLRMKAGWFGLSIQNNPDLGDVVRLSQHFLGTRFKEVTDTPVGLTFFPNFNAAAYPSSLGQLILMHVPLVFSLDALNTFARELQVWRHEPQLAAPGRLEVLKTVIVDGLDFIVLRKAWMSTETMRMLEIYRNTARGPDDRWHRFGYSCALTQRCWILLHEYGHVVLGHGPAPGAKAHDNEFAADAFATELIAHATRPDNMFPLEVALPLLFDILEAAERRLTASRTESTHPTATQRRERVRKLVDGWLERQTPEDAAFGPIGL